jgi:hypothetical protein
MSPRGQLITIAVAAFVTGVGLGQCRGSPKPAAPAASQENMQDLERALEVARGDGAACAQRLQTASAATEALQARLDVIAPARASLRSSHPSLLVRKSMLVADVDAVLGTAKESEMSTCGAKSSGGDWSCLVRTYCTFRGCVTVLFRRSGGSGDWVVDFWHKAIQ